MSGEEQIKKDIKDTIDAWGETLPFYAISEDRLEDLVSRIFEVFKSHG